MDPLIFQADNILLPTTCRAIVRQFEKDPDQTPGITIGGLNVGVKDTTDLNISSSPNQAWRMFDDILCSSLKQLWIQYLDHLTACDIQLELHTAFRDSGYNIHKYDKGKGHYDWHQDFHIYPETNQHRAFTVIWYLNTVKEGGETIFRNCTVSPVQGKALIFPATFTYMHKGCVPISGPKYICNAFLLWPNT